MEVGRETTSRTTSDDDFSCLIQALTVPQRVADSLKVLEATEVERMSLEVGDSIVVSGERTSVAVLEVGLVPVPERALGAISRKIAVVKGNRRRIGIGRAEVDERTVIAVTEADAPTTPFVEDKPLV